MPRHLIAAVTMAATAVPVGAQDWSEQSTAATVAEVRRQLGERYALPERRPLLTRALDAGSAAGRYRVADPRLLAERITADLRAAVPDMHLLLTWNPDEYRRLSLPPAASPDRPGEREARYAAQARRANHGVADMRLLGGNIRYVRITDFWGVPRETDAVLEQAMRFAAGGDGIIIDLRGGGGGSPDAVRYLVSHFLPAGTALMLHGTTVADDERTLANLPAGRMVGKPLYLLTDGVCGSACEELVYHVRHYKLGTIVGERTEGAANNNDIVPVAPGFAFSLSVHSPRHALTGTNWEGTGITPDVAVAATRALEVAHARILGQLTSADAADRRLVAWAKAGADARLAPYRPSRAELAAQAGRYGDRTLRLAGNALIYQRPSRAPVPLVPLGRGWFALAGTDYARLRIDSPLRPRALTVEYEDGTSSTFPRSRD